MLDPVLYLQEYDKRDAVGNPQGCIADAS